MDFATLLAKHGFNNQALFIESESEDSNQKDGSREKEATSRESEEEKEKEKVTDTSELEPAEKEAKEVERPTDEGKGKLVMEEDRAQGAVKLGVYLTYFREGGYVLWFFFSLCFLLSYIFRITQVLY